MQPRWYQEGAVNALYNYFGSNSGNPLLCVPTGAGKSFIISMFLYGVLAQYPGQRIIVATHVKELVRQNFDEFVGYWPQAPAGIFSAGLRRRDYTAPITFAGIGTLVNSIDLFGHIDLLIIDEAHLLGAAADGMYMRVILALLARNPNLKVIGLTATAWRTGMGMLTNGEIFTDIAYDICNIEGFKRLFADGYLVPPRAKSVQNEMSAEGIAINAGEFSKSGLVDAAAKNEKISWLALNEALNKNPDRNCRLVFCAGVEHAELAAEMLRYIGLRAQAVHSKMSQGARDDVIAAYRNGELDALTNNGVLTTGFNHRPIDHIIILRLTMSVGLHVQMIGRGMRTFEYPGYIKQDCIVSDHAGNTRRLGPIDDPYIPKMKGKTAGDAPVKICPACGDYNHASARVCAGCGEPFEIRVGYKKEAYEDVLVRSDLPVFETYKVERVYYTQHVKRNAGPTDKPTLKATYSCGLQSFVEFIPFEAPGFGAKRARDWWKRRFPHEGFMPTTVAEAAQYVDKLIPPTAIRVHVNKRYPEVVGHEF